MGLSFFRDSVVRIRAATTVKNGAELFDWDSAESVTISNLQVVPASTVRDIGDRTLQITDRRTLRAAYDADIEAGDRIVYDGETYEIEGEVYHTQSPTGRASSTRATLVRYRG